MQKTFIAPQPFWKAFRVFCLGVSQVSKAQLPEQLEACNPGVQASHYGNACFITLLMQHRGPDADVDDLEMVPVPPGVIAEAAAEQRELALVEYRGLYGLGGTSA